MSKKKAITLLSIVSVLVAFVLVMTFIRFPIGVKNYNSVLGAIDLDYDLQGGTAYTLKLSEDNEEEIENVDDVLDTLEYRLKALGYNNYSIKAVKSTDENVKDYDIRIETKDTSTLSSDIAVIAAFGKVEFYGGTSANPTTEILEDVKVIADSEYVGSVSDGEHTYYQVSVAFTNEGYEGLMALIDGAGDGSSYYLEMRLGDSVLLSGSSPISRTDFTKKTLNVYISNESSARQTALQLGSGGLAYQYEISEPVSVSSPYGKNVATVSAIVIGALVVVLMVAMVVMYKGLGVIGALSLLLFILIDTLMLIAVPGIVLSIGGVIGIAFATVFTAIGICYILNAIKTEFSNSEKTVLSSVKKGFRDTLVPVLNAGAVSGIIAILLFAFANGTLKCFAITLGIGVVVGLISTLLFTRMYTSLILPLVTNKEKFLDLKRAEA